MWYVPGGTSFNAYGILATPALETLFDAFFDGPHVFAVTLTRPRWMTMLPWLSWMAVGTLPSQCTSPSRNIVTFASLAFTETVFPASEPVPTMVADPAQLVVLVVNVAPAVPAVASRLPPPTTATATSRSTHRRPRRDRGGCELGDWRTRVKR